MQGLSWDGFPILSFFGANRTGAESDPAKNKFYFRLEVALDFQ